MTKYIFILSFFLFQVSVYNSVGLADLVIFLLNLYYLLNNRIKLPKTKYKNLLLLLFCWLLIEPFFINEIDLTFFINRLLRLVNLFFGVLIIPSVLFRNKKGLFKAIKFLCIICSLLFILTILEVILTNFNINFDVRLLNRDEPKIGIRPYSIYSEPSILAIVLVLSNYMIYFTKKVVNKSSTFFNFFLFINTITILLTLTFSGIIGILSFLILTLKTKEKIYLISSIFILTLFLNINVDIIKENFTQRFEKIINNEDNSANQRLIGSWTVPYLLLDNIYVGAGTGQEIPFLDKFNLTGLDNFSSFNVKINNSLALIFLENGLIGLFIFVLLILSFYKINKFLPIIILYYTFVHGSYFSAVLWVAIILFISLSLIKKSDQRAQNYNFNL